MAYKDHMKEVPRLARERRLPFEPLYNLVVKSDDVLGISRGHVLKVLDLLLEEGWTLTHSPSPSGTNGKAAYTAVGARGDNPRRLRYREGRPPAQASI